MAIEAPEMTEAVDYTTCCRLCLTDKHSSLSSIYNSYSDSDGLVEKIETLVGVQINITDKISTLLCDRCFITITNWEGYKKKCQINQTKLQELMDVETVASSGIQIKEEPIDVEEVNDVNIIDAQDEDVTIKPEPIEIDEQDLDAPPQLSPHHPEDSDRCANENIVFEQQSEPDAVTTEEPEKTPEDDNSYNNTVSINEKDQEKIEFAAGLCLQSKSAPPKLSELTKIEHTYLEKCRIMVSMFKKAICVCHNHNYGSLKKLLGHLRSLHCWFPPYTCYNCLVTFEGRSGKMKHTLRCPRVNFEFLIRLSELRARTDDKIRLYQNFKCVKCNLLFAFYEEFCEHVDNEHVPEDGPYTCLCHSNFENADIFRRHIHKKCYINYYCDICFLLTPNMEEFRTHCEEQHDNQDDFSFLPINPDFKILTNIQIAGMLLKCREKEKKDEEAAEVAAEALLTNGNNDETEPVPEAPAKGAAICKVCSKVYSSHQNMLRHLKNFHDIDELPKMTKSVCDICGNEFSNYHNMLRHKKMHEEDLKKLQCPECPERFRLNSELKEHMNTTVHTNVRSARLLHKCDDCGEAFKNPKTLEFHQKSSHLYKCGECSKDFHKSADFEQHRAAHLNITLMRNPQTQNYQSVNKTCQACDKTFQTEAELQAHMLLHEKMPTLDMETVDGDSKDIHKHSCLDCNKVYQSSRGLWVHNKRFHPERRTANKDFPKQCDECVRTITTLPAWIMHKQMHKRTAMRALSIHKTGAEPKGNEDSDYHTCKRCFKVFASRYNLKTHMKSHGVNVSPTRTYSKTGKYNKTFWCDICHQACQGMADLNKHKQEHLTEDLPELENQVEIEPRKPQKRIYQYRNSVEIELRPQTQVYCKYCKIPFNSVIDLNRHMDNEHGESDVKPFKILKGRFCCDLCNKTFTTTTALCSHQGWHKRGNVDRMAVKTETKLYKKIVHDFAEAPRAPAKFKCITCADAFDDDTTLQLHILEVHRNINATVLTIKCKLCNAEFSSQAEFDTHEKLHYKTPKDGKTGVLCRFCYKVFSRSDYLNIHISKKHPQHAPVGTFKCSQCDRLFEKQNALTIHLKVHERSNTVAAAASGKPVFKYSCSICHIGFNIPKDLRNHIIANHPF